MMIIYEITCYINEQTENVEVYSYMRDLLKRNEDISLYKSWENGYHVTLFGTFVHEDVDTIYEQLSAIIKENPSTTYNPTEFKQKYLPVATLTNKTDVLETILQNTVKLTKIPSAYKEFQNEEQYDVYLRINRVFDSVYMNHYWKKDITILEVVCDILPFVTFLPEKTISEEDNIYSSGYVSHLSHYLGFLHSLRESDQVKIRETFQVRAARDSNVLESITSKNGLLEGLIQVYGQICLLVDEEKLTFYSPKGEGVFLAQNNGASSRHRAVFEKEEIRNVVIKDKVLCTNRWVLNVLYEKLVLLGIPPIEKFYMNYVISERKYHDSLLGV